MSNKDDYFKDLMTKTKGMQEKIKEVQQRLVENEVEGNALDLCKVKMNGRHEVLGVYLEEGLLEKEKKFIEEIIAAAVNKAVEKVRSSSEETLKTITSDFGNLSDALSEEDDK